MTACDIPAYNTTSVDPSVYIYAVNQGQTLPFAETTPLYRYDEVIEQTSDKDIHFITELMGRALKEKIPIRIEKEDGEYVAESLDYPLYGCGETKEEAVEHLEYEILSLYEELMGDDNFSDEFLRYKEKLKSIVA